MRPKLDLYLNYESSSDQNKNNGFYTKGNKGIAPLPHPLTPDPPIGQSSSFIVVEWSFVNISAPRRRKNLKSMSNNSDEHAYYKSYNHWSLWSLNGQMVTVKTESAPTEPIYFKLVPTIL